MTIKDKGKEYCMHHVDKRMLNFSPLEKLELGLTLLLANLQYKSCIWAVFSMLLAILH